MKKITYLVLALDETETTVNVEETQKAQKVVIPEGYMLADVEIESEDDKSSGHKCSLLCDRDMVDEDRIPRLGVLRHTVSWDRQAGEIHIQCASGSINLTLRLIYDAMSKVEWLDTWTGLPTRG